MKKFNFLIAAAILVGMTGLTACGSSSGVTSIPADTTDTNGTAAEAPAVPEDKEIDEIVPSDSGSEIAEAEPEEPSAPTPPEEDPTPPAPEDEPPPPEDDPESSPGTLGRSPELQYEIGPQRHFKKADTSRGIVPLRGLYLADASALPPVGNSEGEVFAQPCNISVLEPAEPRNVVSRLSFSSSFTGGIHALSAGCMAVKEIDKAGAAPIMLPWVGHRMGGDQTVAPPAGFAFSGWQAEVCHDKIASITPYARKVDDWGVNDTVEWRGPRIGNSMSGLCQWKSSFCPAGYVLSEVWGRFDDTFTGKSLTQLHGVCHRAANDNLAKPTVAAADLKSHHPVQAVAGLGTETCSLSCKDAGHPNGVVAGFQYRDTDGWLEDVDIVNRVGLLCKDLDKNGFNEGELRPTASCGSNYEEFEGTVTLSRGFAANGVYVQTGDLFDQFRLYQTAVDLHSRAEPVAPGTTSISARGGGNGGASAGFLCPSGEVMTGIKFRSGVFIKEGLHDDYPIPTVYGTQEITCAKVELVLLEDLDFEFNW